MNEGLLDGLNKHDWVDFTPRLDVYASNAATPNLGTAPFQFGRYLYIPEMRLCKYDFEIQFGVTGGSGGTGTYIVELPVPLVRQYNSPSSVADRPLGSGYVGLGVGFFIPNLPVQWIASDAAGLSYGGPQERWIQGIIPSMILSGTSSVPVTAASVAVAFPTTLAAGVNASDLNISPTSKLLGPNGTATITTGGTSIAVTFTHTLANVPLASDITITPTASDTATGQRGDYWLSSISTSGFTINLTVAPTTNSTFTWQVNCGGSPWFSSVSTSGFTLNTYNNPGTAFNFGWKLNGNGLLLSQGSPWNFGGAADRISGSVLYETAA